MIARRMPRLQGFCAGSGADRRAVAGPVYEGVAEGGLIATVGRIPAQDAKEAST
jgi:hypothetical protein